MWLLNATTLKLKWFHDDEASAMGYSILSHTWTDEEVTFEDIKDFDALSQTGTRNIGVQKIEYASAQTLTDGLSHTWIDTCCIDKSSSAELSEAINSMFSWYSKAKVCYAYLDDVIPNEGTDSAYWSFKDSRWFTRGSTLQELIAPRRVIFYGAGWHAIGEKSALASDVASFTRIPFDILTRQRSLSAVCIANRIAWAAGRRTTRVEDRAYSLLGILDIYMPLLYGEGLKAFARLQKEIMRVSTDHSVLLWRQEHWMDAPSLLAPSPDCFGSSLRLVNHELLEPEHFEMTNRGLRMCLPVLERASGKCVVLNCRYETDFTGPIILPLHGNFPGQDSRVVFQRPGTREPFPVVSLEELGDVKKLKFENMTVSLRASTSIFGVLDKDQWTSFDAAWIRYNDTFDETMTLAFSSDKAWDRRTMTMELDGTSEKNGRVTWYDAELKHSVSISLLYRICTEWPPSHDSWPAWIMLAASDRSQEQEHCQELIQGDLGWNRIEWPWPISGEKQVCTELQCKSPTQCVRLCVSIEKRMGVRLIIFDFSCDQLPDEASSTVRVESA